MTSSELNSDHLDETSDVDTDAPHRLSTLKKILFAAMLAVAPLGAAELLCRITGAGAVAAIAPEFSDWHDSPDGRRFWVVRAEGYNIDGMRDREHVVAKPPGVHRIVCLGDSVTVGHGVARHESYPFLLESFLQQMKVPVEVLNVAVSGWSTLQEAMGYELIARKYLPDHVFLGVCLNDVAEMHNNLTEPPPPIVSTLQRHSALVRWLIDAKGREVGRVRDLFTEPPPPAVEDGWRRVFSEIEHLQALTQADGCALSIVVFPFRFQLQPDAPPPVAQERLFRWCFEHDIPSIDLLPTLLRVGPDAFIDESHFSLAGAKAVAEELVQWGRSGCMMCGLDLSGVQSGRCPRCGRGIER